MKNLISLALTLLLTCAFVYGQQGKEKKQAAEKKAAEERDRSMGGYRTNNELKDDRGEITPANNDAGEDNIRAQQREGSTAPLSRNENQMAAPGSPTDTTEQKSNAPAVIQRSTSEGGSPSVLSDNNGYGRDGTGNVQRAKPNMAGAEVPGNFNTAEKNTQQSNSVNGQSNIRREEETPTQITNRDEPSQKEAASTKKKDDNDKKSSRKKDRENRRKKNKG